MDKIEIKAGEWVVVCDGRKALFLENKGDEVYPNLSMRETHEQENEKTSEQGTDRPGRFADASAHGRSAVEQTDWHDQAERAFLRKIAERLEEAVRKKETESLIIVAAPRALGVLRQLYSHGVKEVLRTEIDKDMVNVPVHEIESRLAKTG